jgi:hypothetical protein
MIIYLTKLILSDSNNIILIIIIYNLIIKFYLFLSRDYFPSPPAILSTCNMTYYDMRMRVSPKNAGQVPNTYDSSNLVFNQFGQKIPQFKFILKIVLFSVWVPISEERIPGNRT